MVNKINILNYSNLRMLTFREPSPTQLDMIREHNFPHLEYLILAETSNFSFEILCQFKTLRLCELWSVKIDNKHSCSSLSIRSLILHRCDPSTLTYLFRHLPQMTYLKLTISRVNNYANKFDSTAIFVHPNLMSLNIVMINLNSSINETNTDELNFFSALLAHLSPCNRTRCRLTLCDFFNFNFEQLQLIVFEHNFCRFSCRFVYFCKLDSLPNFDLIRQLPLFNRLQLINTNHHHAVM
jgi:hypothetical protein